VSDPVSAPLVTIVVPVFNGAAHVREGLDSILAQRYAPIEVIVCDDASTDETPDIIASYGSRVVHRRQPENLGIYDNVNSGVAAARGELVATYHADDVYLPEIVERQVAFMRRHPDTGAVFCLDRWIDAEGREYGKLELPTDVPGDTPLPFRTVFDALLRHKNTFLVCPTAMVRADIHRELGGYRQTLFRNSADLDMWIRIAERRPIGVLAEHLMRYRHFHGSSSHRYHYLRTTPERYFAIMDHHLERGAGRGAAPDALVAYEAHRSEDGLLIAASHYIKGERAEARAAVGRTRPLAIVKSPAGRRPRLLLLFVLMWTLTRLPRLRPFARAFYRRWHAKKRPPGAPVPT